MSTFTPFPELDTVLAALVDGARSVLGPRFVGAYLQGSFALGDGDAHSDADFIIVTDGDVDAAGEAALNAMHAALHARPATWAQHLEGSYVPATIFRRITGVPAELPGAPRDPGWRDPQTGQPPRVYPFLFLNNGDSTLVRSQHDNTLVVR
ncbi:MAG: nucleotidyltransferase domain-containing protein [Dehalococcoidia bacterium]